MHYFNELTDSTLYFRELVFKLFNKVYIISLGININEWASFPSFACCKRCTVEEIFLSQKKFWFVASLSKTRNVFTCLYKDLKSSRLRIHRALPPPIFCKTVSIMFIVISSVSLSGAHIKTITSCFSIREDTLATVDENGASLDFLPSGNEKIFELNNSSHIGMCIF